MRELEIKENRKSQESNWRLSPGVQDLLICSEAVLPSEPPDSLMVEEYRIVLISKLSSNLALSNSGQYIVHSLFYYNYLIPKAPGDDITWLAPGDDITWLVLLAPGDDITWLAPGDDITCLL